MSKKWFVFIFILSLAVVALIGLFFYPQGVEWYKGLTELQQSTVSARVISGVFLGVMIGVLFSMCPGVFLGLLLGLLVGVGAGVILDGSNGLAFASHSIGFVLSFCISFVFCYLRRDKKTRQL